MSGRNENISGSHWEGPVLGSSSTRGGLYSEVPHAALAGVHSPYQTHVEDFRVEMADGLLQTSGFTEVAIGTPASPAESIDASTGYLLLDPGTGDDDGSQQKFDIPAAGLTTANPQFDILGSFASTTTIMDNREMFYETRIGFDAESDDWGGKAVFGWLTDDDSLMLPATGALTIVAGGGTGFHVAEDGTLGYFSTNAAVTSSTDTGVNVKTDQTAAADFVWYTLGWRTRWGNADAGEGHTDFFVNGRKVGTIIDTMPMDSTETYAMAWEYMNGAAGNEIDVAVDYLITGITRPGLVYPYSSGTW